jgi:hypothetical protein
MAVGKSVIASKLIELRQFRAIKSGAYLSTLARQAGIGATRTDLQCLGDKLDEETDYRWLIDDVARPLIEGSPMHERWLLDSVRKLRQVQHFRDAFSNQVCHVHLTAPEALLRQRYETRLKQGASHGGVTPYDVAVAHPNEISSRKLSGIADLSLDISAMTATEAAQKIFQSC